VACRSSWLWNFSVVHSAYTIKLTLLDDWQSLWPYLIADNIQPIYC